MAAGRIVLPGWMPAIDSNGAPIPNAQIYFYLNGTTTLATVYSSSSLSVPLSNPVVANSSGQFPEIWADDANLFSVSVAAPYGPAGIPFSFDGVGPATAAAVTEAGAEAGAAAATAIVGPRDGVNGFVGLDASLRAEANTFAGKDYVEAGSSGFLPSPGGFWIGRGDPRMGANDGSVLGADGHGNWIKIQSAKAGNPTEFLIYASGFSGRAQGLNGTNLVEYIDGNEFTPFSVGDCIYFAGRKLRITGKPTTTRLAVEYFDSSPIVFDTTFTNEFFKWLYTTGTGVASVVGGQIVYVSGTPFPPLFLTDFTFTLNGVEYDAADLTFIDQSTYGFTGTPPSPVSNVPFSWRGNINDQNSTMRLQLEIGTNEENVNLFSFAGHPILGRAYHLTTGYAGSGKSRPLYMGVDYWGAGDPKIAAVFYPNLSDNDDAANRDQIPDGGDFVTLGGQAGNESLRVLNASSKTANANRLEVSGGPTGFGPILRARGADTNVTLNYEAKGAGKHTFTHGGDIIVDMNGLPSPNAYLELTSLSLGFAAITAKVANGATDADLLLAGTGTNGRIRFGTYTAGTTPAYAGTIEIKDSAGNLRKIMVAA